MSNLRKPASVPKPEESRENPRMSNLRKIAFVPKPEESRENPRMSNLRKTAAVPKTQERSGRNGRPSPNNHIYIRNSTFYAFKTPQFTQLCLKAIHNCQPKNSKMHKNPTSYSALSKLRETSYVKYNEIDYNYPDKHLQEDVLCLRKRNGIQGY